MISQTRLAILGLTVVTRLMVRETVAMETLAARAMGRISMRSDVLGSTSEGFAFLSIFLSFLLSVFLLFLLSVILSVIQVGCVRAGIRFQHSLVCLFQHRLTAIWSGRSWP